MAYNNNNNDDDRNNNNDDDDNNNNNNKNRIERCNSRFFHNLLTALSPKRTLKWLRRNRVQITCVRDRFLIQPLRLSHSVFVDGACWMCFCCQHSPV